MIIETTLGELDETLYKYSDLLGWADGVEVREDKKMIGIMGYRIQIPGVDLSLRRGYLMSQHGGRHYERHDARTGEHIVVDDPPPEDAKWEIDATLTVICALKETDPNNYLGWTTDGFQAAVYDVLRLKPENYSDLDDISCFIDTSDFMESEEKARQYATECEEEYGEGEDRED